MYLIKKYSVIIFGLLLLPSNISADIEIDYFNGRKVLRSAKTMQCSTLERKQECRAMCGPNNYGCIFDACVCLEEGIKNAKKKREENLPPSKQDIKMLHDFEDLVDGLRRPRSSLSNEETDEEEPVELQEHPALRHHIAHFCPDLTVARTCIRKCMKVGKPAFCGKDHRCYCGHKYSDRDVNVEVNADDVYAQFRDIYAKYFGAETTRSKLIDDFDFDENK